MWRRIAVICRSLQLNVDGKLEGTYALFFKQKEGWVVNKGLFTLYIRGWLFINNIIVSVAVKLIDVHFVLLALFYITLGIYLFIKE